MEAILQVENVTKTIKGKKLVDNISFSVQAGEVFGFLGPNGAGKTTTIRMLVGLIKQSEGSIIINGKDVVTQFKDAMHHVGCIVENPELYSYLTGWENLKQFARMFGGVPDNRLHEIVTQVRLTERIHDRVKTYSLGMKQRLGIAQALIGKPKLLILDEPTNGLDPAGIRELREFVRYLVKTEDMSVFISSHLLSEIQLMCDRVAIIDKGKMITVSTVADLIHRYSSDYIEWIVSQPQKAAGIIGQMEEVNNLKITGDKIQCQMPVNLIAQTVKNLVGQNIEISSVSEKTMTLEDLFMRLTGGQQHA